MKSLQELLEIDKYDYEHDYVGVLGSFSNNNKFLYNTSPEEQTDIVKETIILQAIHKKGFNPVNDAKKLQFLYDQLNDKNSPLSKIAEGVASIRSESARTSELESKYIDDVMYGSAKNFYCHPSDKEAQKYKEVMGISSQAVTQFQQARRVNGKEIKPVHQPQSTIVSEEELMEYDRNYTIQKDNNGNVTKEPSYGAKCESDFNRHLKTLQDGLEKYVKALVADNEKREKEFEKSGKPDPRSNSYKEYVKAARIYLNTISDKKASAERIEFAISFLGEKAEAYKNEHSGFTKGMIGAGRTRFKGAEKISSLIQKTNPLMTAAFNNAYGKKMVKAFDTLEQYGQKTHTHQTLQEINRKYDLAVKKQVISKYNQGKLSMEDALATSIALTEIGESCKETINAAQENYHKETLDTIFNENPFKQDIALKAKIQTIKGSEAFKDVVKRASIGPKAEAAYKNLIVKGKANKIYETYKDCVKNREAAVEKNAQKHQEVKK